jgi:GTP-binding protein
MRVVFVGRPNSGKSSLFNLFVPNYKNSVVSPVEGVTKDWRSARSTFGWEVIDTPGFEDAYPPVWWDIFADDLVIWMLDSTQGITSLDNEIFKFVIKHPNVVLCWNKHDLHKEPHYKSQGLKTFTISTKTRHGLSDFTEFIEGQVQRPSEEQTEEEELAERVKSKSFIVVGQPNAGKSSLVNALLKQSRVLVSSTPGTTVDCVDIDAKFGTICDTPGIKRRKYEGYMNRAIYNAKERIEHFRGVVLYVIDASQPSVTQDLKLAGMLWSTENPILCLLNKWDLVDAKKISQGWLQEIRRAAPTMIVLPISTKTRLNLAKINQTACMLMKKWSTRITTGELNRWSQKVIMPHQSKIQYIAQVGVCPPKLFLAGKKIAVNEKRYIVRKFRDAFKFNSIPIQVEKDIF